MNTSMLKSLESTVRTVEENGEYTNRRRLKKVMGMSVYTDPEELKKFHMLLMADAPRGYTPYYFPLEKNGKDPWKGMSWKQNRKTFNEAYNLMKQGFNIGIAAIDTDPLVIVDIDDLNQIKSHKPTLENQSRKRIGRHCFYFTEDTPAKSIFENSSKQNIATEDAGEVRSNWQYVVAAGSYVPVAPEEYGLIPDEDKPNAGKYSVMVEHSVQSITYDELPEAYRVCLENKRATDIANRNKKNKRPVSQDKDGKNKSALWSLTINDVTGKHDDPTHRFPSPFHGSKTYKDTSVSNGMLHCWRHNVSHTALTYMAVECGLSTCSGAGFGHNGAGSSDVNFDDPKTVYTIWLHAKNHGHIPNDDPIPAKAMVYYALQSHICEESEVVDGWKLPKEVYNEVVEHAPFDTGRERIKTKTESIGQAIRSTVHDPVQIAQALQDSIPIYFDIAKNYWMWNDELKKYDRVDETEIMCQISSGMDLTIYKSQMKQEILEAIRITGRKRRVQPTKKEWIQFENTVVNIETGEKFEATPDYFFVSPIPHKLGTAEETPIINTMFKSWHSEKAALLCEICAYCMYDGYPIQRIFALVGSGSNGKGQFMTLLRRLVGIENCVGTDLDRLAKSQFEASKLYKKKAAFIGETNYNTLSRTNMLKALSGGDLVSCEFKGRDSFDFINTAKILIATNGLPATTDRSDGFYRRWSIVEFKNKFKDGKDIVDEIPETEYENLCMKCIRILNSMLKAGKMLNEETQEARKDKYESLSNPVQAFVNDECIDSDNSFVPIWYLYEQYESYREKRGHRKISKNEFTSILRSMDYETNAKKYNEELQSEYTDTVDPIGKNWKSVFGLRLKGGNYSTPEIDTYTETEAATKKEVTTVTDDVSPLQLIDSLIIEYVKKEYPNHVIKDEYEFERKFIKQCPYFAGSIVRARMHVLRTRGWK